MAKAPAKKKEHKIDLFGQLIPGADAKRRDLFKSFNDEQINEFNAFMPQRWLTGLQRDQEGLSEWLIRNANVNSNMRLGDVGKEHKELQYLLLTTISPYPISGIRRALVKPIRKSGEQEKKINALSKIYPAAKISDLDVLLKVMTDAEFRQLLDDHDIKLKDD